jgi:hypothetical protein
MESVVISRRGFIPASLAAPMIFEAMHGSGGARHCLLGVDPLDGPVFRARADYAG